MTKYKEVHVYQVKKSIKKEKNLIKEKAVMSRNTEEISECGQGNNISDKSTYAASGQ